MNCFQLMQYAIGLESQGRLGSAIDAYRSAANAPNPFGFGPAYLNMHSLFIKQGDKVSARQALLDFLNCPVLPTTIDLIPKVRQEIEVLNQQLNPQPMPQPQPEKK